MATKAGGAYIEIRGDHKKLQGDLNAAHSKVATAAKKMQGQVTRVFKRMAIVAIAAFAAIIGSSALAGAKFQQTLTETATVAQAFGKDLEALEDKARELGKTTAFTATEAAQGMYSLASAGLTTRQVIDAVEHSMKLAGATGSGMAQATQIVASSLKQFGMDASETRRITDTYAAAITNSQLTMDKLTEAMKFAGTTGSALGWTIEQTTAAVAQFANLGLEGSMAGTNLRMAMIQLIKQMPKATLALKAMGLTFEDVNPETHTFGEILKTIGERAITTKQAVVIFGARAALNMKKLAESAVEGKSDFAGFVDMIRESQKGVGRTTQMYDRMMDTFKGQWKIMWSAIQELGISVFDVYKDQGKAIFTFLAKKVVSFADMIGENKVKILEVLYGIISSFLSMSATMIGATGQISAIWAYMWANIKTTFGLPWFEDHIINPLKTSYKWVTEKLGVALEYYFGEGGVLDIAGEFYKDNSTKQAREAYDAQIAAFAGFQSKITAMQEGLEANLTKIKKEEAIKRITTDKETIEAPPSQKGIDPLVKPALISFTEEQLEVQKEFNLKYADLGKSRFDLERKQLDRQVKIWREAEISKDRISKLYSDKSIKIAQAEQQAKLAIYSNIAGQIAGTFMQIAQAGGRQSKKAFMLYQAFAIAQAGISTAMAYIKTLAEPLLPFPSNVVMANIILGMGAVQIAMITAAKPPSFDQGGISEAKGIYQTGNIREAHIPIPSGGKIPVNVNGGGTTIIIKMENPVFQDVATQRQVFAQIASVIAAQVAPGAVIQSYKDDEPIRALIRGRA